MSNIFSRARVQSEPGAKLYFYATGTSTPQNTYQDIDLTTPHANPVVADAEGFFATIYFDATLPDYRYTLTDADDVVLEGPIDDVPSAYDQSTTYRLKGTAPQLIFEETDATTDNKKWRIRVNSETITIDIGDDAESTWTNKLSIGRASNEALILNGFAAVTVSGIDGVTTTNIAYARAGNIACVYLSGGITGTSNSTSFAISNLPDAITAGSSTYFPISGALDNGAVVNDVSGYASPAGGGSIAFLRGLSSTGWTASGTKELNAGTVLIYAIALPTS